MRVTGAHLQMPRPLQCAIASGRPRRRCEIFPSDVWQRPMRMHAPASAVIPTSPLPWILCAIL